MTTMHTPRRAAAPAATTSPAAPDVSLENTANVRVPETSFVARFLTTACVVAALAGAAYWGHKTDSSFGLASVLAKHGTQLPEDWCAEHNVPESTCIECNVSLSPTAEDFGWCKQHGVSQCPLEHPQVAQSKTPFAPRNQDLAQAKRALEVMPRTENNSRCKLYLHRIQFASAAAVDRAGIDIDVVSKRPLVESVAANGEIVYDQNRIAHLSSRVPGTLWRAEREVGQQVAQGEVLALVDAAEVGRFKAEYLQALAQTRSKSATLERLLPLSASGSIPQRQFREAEAAVQETQIRLLGAQQALINLGFALHSEDFASHSGEQVARQVQFLGLPAALLASLEPSTTTSNLLPIKSPLAGVVVERDAVPGESVDSGKTLFTVADVSQMWLVASVRQEDVRLLSLGQSVQFQSSAGEDEDAVTGQITWISTAADPRTRTVKVRVNLPNAAGRLRANTFGAARIVLREEPSVMMAPNEAIHSDGCCSVVFVRSANYLQADAPKFFHIRQVRLGAKHGDATEIIAGLAPGEVIATRGSGVLEAQLLKSKLGEGCGCCAGAKKD